MAGKDILSQSIFSDLKRGGANDQQIMEMFGVKQLDNKPPTNIPQQPPQNINLNNNINNNNINNNNIKMENIKKNNQLNNSKEEIENKQSEISSEILFSISSGNKENYLSNDDVEVLKRDNYPENFTKIPNGICSFLGRKNNRNFEEYQLNIPHQRIRLFNNENNNNNNNNNDNNNENNNQNLVDEIVVSSLIIKNSSFSFIRKSLPIPPSSSSPSSSRREESKVTMGENGLALLTNPNHCPLLYEWKRNEVMGEAKDIEEILSKKGIKEGGFPNSSIADEEGKNIFLSTVSSDNELNFVEWPVDMSLKLRLFHLYSFDVNSNFNLNDDNNNDQISFYSPSRRNRVKLEVGIKHEIKLSEKWIIIFTYKNNFSSNQKKNLITIYFIDRSTIPKRAENDLNLDHILNNDHHNNDHSIINSYELEAIELNSFKVEILNDFEGNISEIGVGYEDGNGSNVCVTIIPSGSSFNKFDRIEKTDKLRSKSHQNNNQNLSRSFFQSFSNSLNNFAGVNSANNLHKLDEKLIGLPCSDQNADQKPNFVRHLFLDPKNPPNLQLSRSFLFDKSLKGTVGQINKRARSKEGFIYLSVGTWPELDIHRTNDPSNLLLPPPSRHFPSLFTSEKSFLFDVPSYVTAATFIPSNDDPFSFSDLGYIVLAVVTEDEGRLTEEFQIFDSKEFENGPAFVIRPKSPLELSFNFGVSNYTGDWGDLKSLLH